MTDVDPRVEAAARAMQMPIAEDERVEGDVNAHYRLLARRALAAADAADPLRDRGRAVPTIEQALAGLGGDPDPDVYAQAAMAVFDALNGEQET